MGSMRRDESREVMMNTETAPDTPRFLRFREPPETRARRENHDLAMVNGRRFPPALQPWKGGFRLA